MYVCTYALLRSLTFAITCQKVLLPLRFAQPRDDLVIEPLEFREALEDGQDLRRADVDVGELQDCR